MGAPCDCREDGSLYSVHLGNAPEPGFLFFRACCMLMGSDNCTVDHQVFVFGIFDQQLKDLLPNTCSSPSTKPSMCVVPIAIAIWKVAPGWTWSQNPHHSVHELAIVFGCGTYHSYLSWKYALNLFPLLVTEFVSSAGLICRSPLGIVLSLSYKPLYVNWRHDLKTARVKNWKSKKTDQILRWVASSLAAHRPKMRRLRGHKESEQLVTALGGRLAIQVTVA